MKLKEQSRFWYNPRLDLESYQATCVKSGFPLHMHDYFVICLIEQGLQSFTHHKAKHLTPAGGLIILNPGDDHTGEPADDFGFEYRAIYPRVTHMEDALSELNGKRQEMPYFPSLRIDDPDLAQQVRTLHTGLSVETPPLELDSLFLMVLAHLIRHYAENIPSSVIPGHERRAVKRACDYIRAHAIEGMTLMEIADHVGLSRFYFLRVFHKETGMPPHAYMESVRISHAKKLLEKGLSLNQVAHESGFSDQSHFTNRFKRLVGVTPGQYAQEIRN